jgi:hypothetical protein
VKTSEKHRHGQALLAMSVFFFFRQDSVAKTKLAGFCQVKSRRNECPVTDFKARIAFSKRDKLWVMQEWLKGGERATQAGYGGLDGYSKV